MHGDTDEDDRIDLSKLLLTVWSCRHIVALWVAVFVVFSILYLHVAGREYTAAMTVVSAQNTASSDSIGSGLGDLASLAGVRLPKNAASSPFDAYVMGMNTPETAMALLKRKDIASVIFPAGWDPASGTWRDPGSPVRIVTRPIKWILTGQQSEWQPPNAKMMADYIKRNVLVSRDKTTNAVTITFSYRDRAFAEHFLRVLHKTVDDAIRAKTLKDTSLYISYITEQLKVVTITEQHDALTRLLSDQEKKVILAGSGLPYAAEVFSAPYAPPVLTKPMPSLTLTFGVFAGAFFGIIFVLAAKRFTLLGRLSDALGGGVMKAQSWDRLRNSEKPTGPPIAPV